MGNGIERSEKYAGVFSRRKRDGSKTFYIRYTDEATGKDVFKSVGSSLDGMTERRANAVRNEVMKGAKDAEGQKVKPKRPKHLRPVKEAGTRSCSVGDLWAAYLDIVLTGKSRLSVDRSRYAKYIEPVFGKADVGDLVTLDIDRFRKDLSRKGLKPATVRDVLQLLQRVINFGVKRGYVEKPSFLYFNVPSVDNQKTEMLDDEQLARYVKALADEEARDPVGVAFLRIIMHTGMRSSALCALRWEDCDFEKGIITLRGEHAKHGHTAHIAKSQAAKEALLSLEPKPKGWVFPSTLTKTGHRKDFRPFAVKIKKLAQLPDDYRITYCLRHNFASRLASSGKVDIYTLQRALTHRTIAMTQRYAHLTDEAARRVAAVTDEVMSVGAKTAEEDPK